MQLENERYIATFTTKGGEIESFKDKQTGIEYMWQGDDTYWKGKNPTLFPLIGSTCDEGHYTIDGHDYFMKNHGIVRYEDLIVKDEHDTIIMTLDSSDKTRRQYPFDFHYEIEYVLIENCLHITYRITNTGMEMMPFMLGAHPGFNCPLCTDERYEDYTIRFSQSEHMEQLIFDHQKKKPVTLKKVDIEEFACDYQLYETYDTLIYRNPSSRYVTLQGKEHGIRMGIEGFPYIIFWSPARNAPFLCIQPWYGHGDLSCVKEDFYHREGMMTLHPDETFTATYTIEIF